MTTRRQLLASGAAIAAAALAGCSDEDMPEDSASAMVPKDEVPVGGGTVLPDAGIVITQPEAGVFLGFSSLCTHQGCDVSSVGKNGIHCVCHNSLFSITDGAPTSGPAIAPLRAVSLVDDGDSLSYKP